MTFGRRLRGRQRTNWSAIRHVLVSVLILLIVPLIILITYAITHGWLAPYVR